MARRPMPVSPGQARKLVLGCALVVAATVGIVVLLVLAGRYLRTSGIKARLVEAQAPALIAAAITGLLWLGALGAVRWIRRPRSPEAAAATSELGPEPPAVAGLLTNDFEVRREALPATLLDLAARRFVDVEDIGPEIQLRLRGGEGGSTLLPYERRVLDLVRSRAVGGVVPAPALTSGPPEHAREWWRSFRNEVIDDAQARGLSRDLWDRRVLWLTSAGALVPAAFALLGTRNWGAPAASLVAAFTVITPIRQHRQQRDTARGLAAASGWLGVRRHLRDGAFPDLPPAAVTIWERYLAYAAAFGVARNAVRAIPMGAEDHRRAWSTFGGRWREVRVRYPFIWPPAWGWIPWVALGASVVGIAAGAGLIRVGAAIGWPTPTPDIPRGFITFLRGLTVAVWTAGSLIALWSVVTLARSLGDLGRVRRATGQVVRLRTFGRSSRGPGRHYLALDDGTTDVIRAWRVPDDLWRSAPISQYRTATVTVGSFLGRVRSIEPAG